MRAQRTLNILKLISKYMGITVKSSYLYSTIITIFQYLTFFDFAVYSTFQRLFPTFHQKSTYAGTHTHTHTICIYNIHEMPSIIDPNKSHQVLPPFLQTILYKLSTILINTQEKYGLKYLYKTTYANCQITSYEYPSKKLNTIYIYHLLYQYQTVGLKTLIFVLSSLLCFLLLIIIISYTILKVFEG